MRKLLCQIWWMRYWVAGTHLILNIRHTFTWRLAFLEFTTAGRVGSCREGIKKTIMTKKPQIVMLGSGDRVWGGAQNDEVLFLCPANKLDPKLSGLMEGLETTHRAGPRYPVPAHVNSSPGFQESFESRAIERAGGIISRKQG